MPWAGFVKPINIMSDFRGRLLNESADLEDKLDSFNLFLASDKVKEIDDVQKALLQVQSAAMNTYLQCLCERIQRL